VSAIQSQHALEVHAKDRFTFGANWTHFLASVTEKCISLAAESLRRLLGRESLTDLSFLDAGSGNGLSSLAARCLGASVLSSEFDPQLVACTTELRRRYRANDPDWRQIPSVMQNTRRDVLWRASSRDSAPRNYE
jgi:hypothetical protein